MGVYVCASVSACARARMCVIQIENWDHMERFWQRCIFKHLRCAPEEHFFCLVSIHAFLVVRGGGGGRGRTDG